MKDKCLRKAKKSWTEAFHSLSLSPLPLCHAVPHQYYPLLLVFASLLICPFPDCVSVSITLQLCLVSEFQPQDRIVTLAKSFPRFVLLLPHLHTRKHNYSLRRDPKHSKMFLHKGK